jgi:hypothetical protein
MSQPVIGRSYRFLSYLTTVKNAGTPIALIKFNDFEPELTVEVIPQNVRQTFPIRFASQSL